MLPRTPSYRLDGKRAVVIGGSRGIGLGCAVALAEQGASVVKSGAAAIVTKPFNLLPSSLLNNNETQPPNYAGVKPGKAPGAFAHPTVTDVHPYIMLNYLGKPRDVMTLAHELGHGVHQVLASSQGQMLSSTPLTLAETASVFGAILGCNPLT